MNNKLLLIYLLLGIIVASCSKNDLTTTDLELSEPQGLLSIDQINKQIDQTLKSTGDFDWSAVDDHFLWSALTHGRHILSVGYGAPDESFSEEPSEKLLDIKKSLIQIIATHEGIASDKVPVNDYEIINVFDVEVKSIETIRALRESGGVRYLQPNGYSVFTPPNETYSSSGCSKDAQSINAAHYTVVAPNNAQVSWNFYKHNIPQAWNLSTGAGVTVGLIDTGVSASQSLLNTAGFNNGYSSGRTVQKYGTFIDSPWFWSTTTDGPHDKCGHGTAMASAIVAPRNDRGMPVGVAYNANLIAYRATEDVLLNDYHERKGVTDALVQLGSRSDVKIISMSIGYVWSIGNIKDAVQYAYSKDKLIFAAGGTSTSFTNGYGVIFPATMTETVAVTGVTDGSVYQRCDVCHSGSKIDFTIIMEGHNNTSKAPPVLGFNEGERRYTGGSSVATATTAGIAALVWSRYPSWTRAQVLNRLKQSSEFYPNRNQNFGHGNVDALQAVQ